MTAHPAPERGVTPGDRAARPGPGVAVVACAAQFMVVLDALIVQVGLPTMRAELGLSQVGQQWVVNAYLLVLGGFLLLGGRAADLWGRRRVFLVGLGVFTVFSLLGGLAPTGGLLIAARALQGLGAALLAPSPVAVIAAVYTDPQRRAGVMGVWSATTTLAGSAAVLLGGALTEAIGWRAVLLVNVPIGLILLPAAARFLPALAPPDGPTGAASTRRIDLPGAAAATAGFAALVFGLGAAETRPWSSPAVSGAIAAGVVLLVIFVLLEARSPVPLLRLGLLRVRSLAAGNTAMLIAGALTTCSVYFLSLYLQQVWGFSPWRAGLGLLPMTLAIAAASLTARRVVDLVGPRPTLAGAAVVLAGGLFWLSALTPTDGFLAGVLGPTLVAGVGLGVAVLPITLAAMTGVPVAEVGVASSIMNTSRQLGGGLGLAVLSSVAGAAAGHASGADSLATGDAAALFVAALGAVLLAATAALLPPRRGRAG